MWRLKEKYHGDYEEYCTVSTSLWENYKETGEKVCENQKLTYTFLTHTHLCTVILDNF